MKRLKKKEFKAIADNLIPIETLDSNLLIFLKREDDKISFYSYNKSSFDIDSSYWYMFSLSVDSFHKLTTASENKFEIVDFYTRKFLEG